MRGIRALIAALALCDGAAQAAPLGGMGTAGAISPTDTIPICQKATGCGTTDPLRSATIGNLAASLARLPVVPAKTVQVPCGASLTATIAATGGEASAAAPVLYQLAGSAGSPCTYSGFTPTAVSNIIIQGDTSSPVGANTIIDGGQQGGSAGYTPFLNGGPSGIIAGGTSAANVTIQYVTIQHYGGGATSGNGFGSVCGWVAFGTDPRENWCPMVWMGNNWTIQHSTLQLSGGYAIETAGGNILIANNLITANQHGGITIQSGWIGTNGGSVVFYNNECTGNNARGDDPANDANGCFKAVYQPAGLGGGPQQALYAIDNYAHDNNAAAYWCDIKCSNALVWTGNTAMNSLSPSTFPATGPACYQYEVTGGHAEISHNFAAECSGAGYNLVNSSNVAIHDNYIWVDLDLAAPGGLQAFATCRSDNDAAADPLSNIKAYGNAIAYNKTVSAGSSASGGARDLTGPLGSSCSGGQASPTYLDYATNAFFGNQSFVPAFTGTIGAGFEGFGASTIGAAIGVWQGTGGPWVAPFSSTGGYAGWANGDCTVHVTTVPAGFTVQEGMQLWGTLQTTPVTISQAGGGVGQYAINWCPSFASAGSPATLNSVFGGNQEQGSVLQTGATATGSSISGTTLTIGTVTNGTVAAGMPVYGNDGTHKVPFGTLIQSNISGSGNGSTWTLNNSLTLTSTTVYLNQARALHLGCQNGIATGGCPNGSGM
jgi:hypothetical protein